MKETNRFFGRILNCDNNLGTWREGNFAVRLRSENEITLLSLSGKMLRLLRKGADFAPDSIVCEKLPPGTEKIAEDGWSIEDSVIRIPYFSKIDLTDVEKTDLTANIEIRDFPGHLKGMIARRLRQADFARFKLVEDRLGLLSAAINEHLTESAEIPLVEVVGFGEGHPAMGDAALCGLLLTGRCLALGKRFKVNWYSRLRAEIRRLLHRTDVYGRSWLGYALEGRMTVLQRRFFETMARDYECAGEMLVRDVAAGDDFGGRAFLLGCFVALEMVQKDLFRK